jgi:hypothetical protein
MREIHVRHAPARFAPCNECKAEPNHYIVQGRTQRETMRFDIPAVRHSLECRCGRSTGHHGSLHSAEADWGTRHSQKLLALPSPAHFDAPSVLTVDWASASQKDLFFFRQAEVAHG